MTINIPQTRKEIKTVDTYWRPSTVAFGPGSPISPASPAEPIRGFDYMVGRNYQVTPRASEARVVTFAQMRSLSKLYGVLRTIIEKCKDEIRGIEWDIQVRDGYEGYDDEAKKERKFWDHPDGSTTFDQWLGAIEEDRLVIDAATLMKHRNKGGELTQIEPIDGSTILVLVNDQGRVPNWPEFAYEQVIKGYPRTAWTKNAIAYRPYNVSTEGVYGFSHVESIIMTVNIALRRDTLFLEHFKSGNMPYGLLPAPENWTPEQMFTFQAKFDDLLSGDLGERSKLQMFPGAGKPEFIQPLTFDAQLDEWLARIVCARFGKSPQPYVKEMNRATSQTAQQTSTDISLIPTLQYYKAWFDELIAERGKPYLEFAWTSGQLHFEKSDAEINDMMLKSGAVTIDWLRKQKGEAPYPDGLGAQPMIWTGTGPILLKDVIEGKVASQPMAGQDANGMPIVPFSTIGKPPQPKDVNGVPIIPFTAIGEAKALSTWEKFALNRLGKKSREFDSTGIPDDVAEHIKSHLKEATTPEAVKAVFAEAKKKALPQHRHAVIKRHAEPYERALRLAVGKVLDSLKKEALHNAQHHVTSKDSPLIDKHQAKVKLQGVMQPIMHKALAQAIGKNRRKKRTEKALLDYVLDQHSLDWLTSHLGWAAEQIGEETANMLSQLLGEAYVEGQSIGQIRDALTSLISADGSAIFSESRALLIAETEVMSAYRMGDLAQLREGGYFEEVQLDPAPDACGDCFEFANDTYTLEEAEGIEGPHGGTWCNCRCLWKAVNPGKNEGFV